MINAHDLYMVISATTPLYFAMFLAYASVRWWKILNKEQSDGVNRFVSFFAVPFLNFHFISKSNLYEMNFKFIAADTIQKVIVLVTLTFWASFTKSGDLDWLITIFPLSTLPNNLIIGIPLLVAMYGEYCESLMVQIVVMQCVVWYTLLIFLYEYRAAKMLLAEQFQVSAVSQVSDEVSLSISEGKVNHEPQDAQRSPIRSSGTEKQTPRASVMLWSILVVMGRKLIRNPNTFASIIGLIWSLIHFRWNIEMPMFMGKSITLISDAGLGMAMFTTGLFMALQPSLIPCGKTQASYAMVLRFLIGPAVMAAASLIVGIRGELLQVAIVQAALPQGILPFVFAKEYNLHPKIQCTAVVFGMVIAIPVTLVYYILLGL